MIATRLGTLGFLALQSPEFARNFLLLQRWFLRRLCVTDEKHCEVRFLVNNSGGISGEFETEAPCLVQFEAVLERVELQTHGDAKANWLGPDRIPNRLGTCCTHIINHSPILSLSRNKAQCSHFLSCQTELHSILQLGFWTRWPYRSLPVSFFYDSLFYLYSVCH